MDVSLILVFLHHLGKALLHWNQAVCQSKWIIYLEFHGILPGFLLGTLWLLSGWIRSKELDRINGGKTPREKSRPPPPQQQERRRSLRSSTKIAEEIADEAYPSVAIVLPTRGYRPNSLQNWQAVLHLDYPGHLEFIFVVEDQHDLAHPVIQKLVNSTNKNSKNSTTKSLGGSGASHSQRSARIVYSGLAAKSSQKIQNLIAGISAATKLESNVVPLPVPIQYILCLDDDVQLHPTALVSFINDMEAAPDLRIATGYPFDIPAAGNDAGVLSYAALAYHLPLVIGFSLNERTHFVWGGCMLFRAQDVKQEDDVLGFLSGWADGGYSDDLTVAARCTELGLHVLCPSYAIFPQYLDAEYSPRRYWNYLRRQLVVLDTYASDHNRRTNHVMAVLHCYFSWAFVVPVLTSLIKVAIWIGIYTLAAAESTLLLLNNSSSAPRLLGESAGNRGELPAPLPPPLFSHFNDKNTVNYSNLGYISAVCFITCSFYAAIALWYMTSVVCAVMEKLNPHNLKPGSLIKRFHWGTLWLGFVASNAVLPLCMVYTFLTRHITWAGVKYHRRSGKIIAVEH